MFKNFKFKNFQAWTDFLYFPYELAGPQHGTGDVYGTFTSIQTLLDLSYTELKTGEKLLPTTESPIEWLGLKYVRSSVDEYLHIDFYLFCCIDDNPPSNAVSCLSSK